MTLLDALTTLVDSARQQPENRHLSRAIARAEVRIGELRYKREQRLKRERRWMASLDPKQARKFEVEKLSCDIEILEAQAAKARAKLVRIQTS